MKTHLHFKRPGFYFYAFLFLFLASCDSVPEKIDLPVESERQEDEDASEPFPERDSVPGREATATNLFRHQWHLNNTGQRAFSANGGLVGEDIGLEPSSDLGGEGVKVAVVDTGLEIAHEDLSPNVLEGGSWDFDGGDTDPTPYDTGGDHGTSVAGLIAMSGDNPLPEGDPSDDRGGKGVAPKASLVGYNFLESQSLANQLAALGNSSVNPKSDDVDVFNLSYGYSNFNQISLNSSIATLIDSNVFNARGGKGAVYVKSSGNGFDFSGMCRYYRYIAKLPEVSCQNANMDPFNSQPWIVVTGATNAEGVKSSYSTAGANLWVSAPGGEFGRYQPAMITTDLQGCDRGYSKSPGFNPVNSFENNENGLNPNCNYTSRFNGTSSAAPVLSGVMALMLEANPDLTLRDVKKIIAETSDQIDSGFEDVTVDVGGRTHTLERGWMTNRAGYRFHNWYGFGRVNAGKAVRNAQAVTSPLAMGDLQRCGWIDSGAISKSIPDTSAEGTSDAISVNHELDFIETLQISVSVTHNFIGDLGIELTAPSGTRSILLNAGNAFRNSLSSMKFSSNAFYGEDSSGDWKLRIVDVADDDTGTLTRWRIGMEGQGNCVL